MRYGGKIVRDDGWCFADDGKQAGKIPATTRGDERKMQLESEGLIEGVCVKMRRSCL